MCYVSLVSVCAKKDICGILTQYCVTKINIKLVGVKMMSITFIASGADPEGGGGPGDQDPQTS